MEDAHAYAGAGGTPFTAQLVVADNSGLTGSISDPYLVKIEDNTLDARINIAIDNGLWYTYKQGTRGDGVSGGFRTFDATPLVYWSSAGHRVAATASAVQAFEINGSKETGDFDQDPYAEYVARGLKFLIMGYAGAASSPNLRSLAIGLQHGDNPDSNGNGIGIEVYDGGLGIPTYQGGQVMDAIIASGTPAKSSGRDFVGSGHIATYAEIIQDMTDMYAWGQTDGAVTCLTTVTDEGVQDLSHNGVPVSVSLQMLNTQCSLGGTFTLFLNGVSLGTVANDPANLCTCTPGVQILTINNAAALAAAWNGSASKTLKVTYTGGGYNSRVNATLDWGGGNAKTICVRSVAGNCFTDYLCDGYNGSAFDSGDIDLSSVHTYHTTTVCAAGGSWIYGWNGGDDNSAAQWAAIGMIPAQQAPWNAVVPPWVKTYDDTWLTRSHSTENSGLWGRFGYRGAGSNVDPYVNQSATTPSGMVQLSFVGATTADPRWVRSERLIAENWDTGEGWMSNGARRNLYAMYAMTKAMRLAKPVPVVNFAFNGLDWYRGSATHDGVAKVLSDNMIANGFYNQTYWEGNPLTTAWAVIMLKPTLFAAAPIACFTAHPNPAYSDLPISFDPTCSGHSEPGKSILNLVKFEWDWNNDGTFDESSVAPDVKSHSFHCASVPCTFPVKLKVTDDAGLTATFVLDINITDPPHPPVSRPKPVYWVSQCGGDTLSLDGSASFDPDEGLHQAGCGACPFDTIIAWDWDLDGAPFTYASASGKIVNLGAGFGATFPTVGPHDIGLRVTDNTALAYPASGQPNLKDEAFSKVVVFAAGPCDLAATAGCDSVHLTWTSTGATSYHVYRSMTGPNADFVEVANTGSATSADVAGSTGQTLWFRVAGVTGANSTMSKAVQVTLGDCVCINDLAARPKDRQVQLTWGAQAGATCYDIYRDTSPNVQLIGAKRIKTCFVPANPPAYLDTGLVNGTKYYYKVTKVVGGVETCVSIEVNATPALPRR